jgi:hypothetical protein
MHIGAARWVLSYERLCLSNFEQTQSLLRATMGLISNHIKALGPFLFRRSGPLFDPPLLCRRVVGRYHYRRDAAGWQQSQRHATYVRNAGLEDDTMIGVFNPLVCDRARWKMQLDARR